MEQVPITFEYKGKKYSGYFNPVFGGGSANVWYLMINKYYFGRLRFTANNEWFFDGKEMNELAQFFGEYVMAWYE